MRFANLFAAIGALASAATPSLLTAQPSQVANTLHNLSVSGPGEIRALTETEVCKFCHIPHNPVVREPLWAHRLSPIQDYRTPELRRAGRRRVTIPQPDGSSRLCLSCHDGTVALGDVGGEPGPIAMAGAQRLGPGRRGFLGTDLSGSHPISFVVPNGDPPDLPADRDMGLRSLSLVRSDPDVELDSQGKMQCTTCHDPHDDRYYQPGRVPRFWVKPSVTEVCLTCHELR